MLPVPRTILVPVDFSEPAEAALDYAVALARKLDAKITLLSVVDLTGLYSAGLGTSLSAGAVDQIIAGNQEALDKLAAARRDTGRIGDVLSRTGDPRELIDAVARGSHIDLIVMGTHGRRGFKRLMLGSVAEAVLRTAPCPVLTVRPPT